jgi:CubicO group peptidase (beta-lactamase class C family)
MLAKKLIESSYLARYFLFNSVDITDYRIFPFHRIENAPPVYQFALTGNDDSVLSILDQIIPAYVKHPTPETADQFLERNDTTAFLIIQGDRLLFERYYNGFQHSSICTSFSTAKSFVSALVGIALNERLIRNIDDPITTYLPELIATFWSQVSIRHLVSMSSGLRYDENSFFPWSDEPTIYYSLNLRQLVKQVRKSEAPGFHFHYNNYNLILLGIILERVTNGCVSEYLQEKIWKPLGMEYPASWSLDSERSSMEKMESGLNAYAIDFAKFGCLYMRRGDWNGKQIIPESWVVESTTVTATDKWTNYKYLWWMVRAGKGRYMAAGNLGQFIYVAPDKNCVIVRFGRGKPKDWKRVYPELFGRFVDKL